MKAYVTKYGYPHTKEEVESRRGDADCAACDAVHRHGGCDKEGVCFIEVEWEDGKKVLYRVEIVRAHRKVENRLNACLLSCREVTTREADLEIAKACAEGRDTK